MSDTPTRRYIEDLEDSTDDTVEVEPVDFWAEKQRDLVTSVVDYNLSTLSDLVFNKDIDVSPRYQRRFRWDDVRQSRLIESFLMNVPVPPIFLNEDSYGQYSVIDGKQRLTAITNFLRGRLTLKGLDVFSDINGMTYDNLPSRMQTILRTRVILRAVIVLRQSDTDVKYEVFRRLNTGGVRLNAQEIRNSVYPGPLNDLILDLSEIRKFHRILGIKQKEQSAIYQEMRDAEFVVRYFTFRETWNTFNGGMRRHMDTFMAKNQRPSLQDLDDMRTDFLSTLDVVETVFGDHAFQRWQPERNVWKKQVLASLYDAQMFGCRGVSLETIKGRQPTINKAFQELFSDPEFRRSIDAATNTPTYFKYRIQQVKRLIEKAISS